MEGHVLNEQLEQEWKNLITAGSYSIYKMSKPGADDFYFDSTDLFQCKEKFIQKRTEGWAVVEKITDKLSVHMPERASDIRALDLVVFDWGYKKA